MIEAIGADFGGVVGTDADTLFVRTLVEDARLPEAVAKHYWEKFWPDLKVGSLSVSEMWRILEGEVEGLPEDIGKRYTARIGIHDEVLDYLSSLGSHFRLGMLANESREWFDFKVRHGKLYDVFTVLRSSAELQVPKPDFRAYELICRELGVPISRTLLIDNMPRNVQEFREIGGKGIVYTDLESCRQQVQRILEAYNVPELRQAVNF